MSDWERINIDKTKKPQQSMSEERRRAQKLAQERRRWIENSHNEYGAPKKQGNFTSADKNRPIAPDRRNAQLADGKKSNEKRPSKSTKTKSKKSPKKNAKSEVDYRSKDDKRREYAQSAKKRRKKRVIKALLGTVGLAACVLFVLSLTVLFKIETLTVVGDTRYSEEEIIEASKVKIGDNLWRTTSKTVTDNVAVALPYIKSAKVRRDIPSGMRIEITETEPAYSIEKNKKYILIDKDDKVLEENAQAKGETVQIKGLGLLNTKAGTTLTVKLEDGLNTAKEIIAQAEENGLSLTQVDVTQTNELTAVYKGRLKLEFGSKSELAEKMKMAREIIKKLESEGNTRQGEINLKSVSKSFYIEKEIDTTVPKDKDDKKGGKTTDKTKTDSDTNAESTKNGD